MLKSRVVGRKIASSRFSQRAARFSTKTVRSVNKASFLRRATLLKAAGAAAAVATAMAVTSESKTMMPVAMAASSIPPEGIPGTKHERSFLAVKPDGVQRGLIGKVLQTFEEKGYKLVAVKMLKPSKRQAELHYLDLAKRPFYPGLTKVTLLL
jgi:nucleoside-diphosphate kinase